VNRAADSGVNEHPVGAVGLPIAVLALFLFVPVAQADWTPTKMLTWNSGYSEGAAIAIDSSKQIMSSGLTTPLGIKT